MAGLSASGPRATFADDNGTYFPEVLPGGECNSVFFCEKVYIFTEGDAHTGAHTEEHMHTHTYGRTNTVAHKVAHAVAHTVAHTKTQ